MSISKIKELSMNPHFYALLMQGVLSGYEKPCTIKLLFMSLSILLHDESRDKLYCAKTNSSFSSLFESGLVVEEKKLSGKVRLVGFLERYNFLIPYCKEAIIILFSENKIEFNDYKIINKEKINYKTYNGIMKKWMKTAIYLGKLLSNTTNETLSYFLGVNVK